MRLIVLLGSLLIQFKLIIPDNQGRYEGQPGTSQRGFGAPILSDDVGDVNGIFLIPNGRAPVVGSLFTNISSVQYQTTGETRSFQHWYS
jgi:hypothetical protein